MTTIYMSRQYWRLADDRLAADNSLDSFVVVNGAEILVRRQSCLCVLAHADRYLFGERERERINFRPVLAAYPKQLEQST